ncbi:MAG TPA: hypothetical protein VFX19_00670 [Dehalococcoidia bacterium]|nr:hypothetical protein [Dehalococcoidia bacterium]
MLLASLVFLAACGSGDNPSGNVDDAPTVSNQDAIKAIDLTKDQSTQAFLASLGSGRVAKEAILYADLTGDKRDEAIVPVTSDGTLGNIGYIVLTMTSGTPSPILTRTMDRSTASGLKMSVDSGTLQETVGVYGKEDPLCCPSQLRKTTFRWDGKLLQVEKETVAANPNGGPKS